MCQQPCATCLGSKFYQCITCQNSQQILKNGLCIEQPILMIQIVCTSLLIIFIIPNLMRKRCVTLMRIFDAIQIVAYFKYINAYSTNRHNYLYLGMRAWDKWSQGWNLIQLSEDMSIPVWSVQESGINKVIRTFIIWCGILTIMLIMGLVKTMMGDSQIILSTYIQKNLPIAFSLGFYINIQDMAFIMANSYNLFLGSLYLSTTYSMIQFLLGIVFAVIFLVVIMWMFHRVNYDYLKNLEKTPKKIYPHVYMFMLALDYDLFQTYELTSLPQKQKKINKFSNIRLIQIFKKVAYAFLIVNCLYASDENLKGQIFNILGLIIFSDIIWYVSLPYDLGKQKVQFVICILADILVIVILVMPLIMSSNIVQMILCLSLFGLAIASVILEFFLDLYKIIPVDLYEIGLSVVIQDKKLLKEIQERKKLQQEHEQRMKQIQQQNKKLRQLLQAEKNNKQKLKDETQQSLPNLYQKQDQNKKFSEQFVQDKNDDIQHVDNEQVQQKTQMNSDDLAQLYMIDEQKRRKIYQYNKKANFTYSNKLEN